MNIQEDVPKQRYRARDKREDGMVFLEYSKIHKGGERWVTEEKYEQILKRKREAIRPPEQIAKHRELKRERYRNDACYREIVKARSREFWHRRTLTDDQRIATNKRVREKRHSSPERLLIHRLRAYLNKVAAISGTEERTMDAVGCSISEFRTHIENLFDIGMTWENRALWHIDHVVPLKSAKTKKQIRRLFHYTNLRPLWAAENLSKGSKQFRKSNKHGN